MGLASFNRYRRQQIKDPELVVEKPKRASKKKNDTDKESSPNEDLEPGSAEDNGSEKSGEE